MCSLKDILHRNSKQFTNIKCKVLNKRFKKLCYNIKIGRLCRATAASFNVNTSLRAERNELNPFMNTFIY